MFSIEEKRGECLKPGVSAQRPDELAATSTYVATRTPPTSITLAPSKRSRILPLVEEYACPDNRENATQLEERCHIPDETERNRREAKERGDTGEQDGGGESPRVGTEPLPGSRGTIRFLCSS